MRHSSEKDAMNEVTANLYEDRMLGSSTVGVIVLDSTGSMCVASSSGGILLKEPGRCGSSCVYGAGCWTEQEELEIDEKYIQYIKFHRKIII